MDKLIFDKRALSAAVVVILVVTLGRLFAAVSSGIADTGAVVLQVAIGSGLALVQRGLSGYAERNPRRGENAPARLLRALAYQLILAFAVSFLIGSIVVLAYVVGAAIIVLNLGLKLPQARDDDAA